VSVQVVNESRTWRGESLGVLRAGCHGDGALRDEVARRAGTPKLELAALGATGIDVEKQAV
jgi:hypothetical protein